MIRGQNLLSRRSKTSLLSLIILRTKNKKKRPYVDMKSHPAVGGEVEKGSLGDVEEGWKL
jgi:hypothetical protein